MGSQLPPAQQGAPDFMMKLSQNIHVYEDFVFCSAFQMKKWIKILQCEMTRNHTAVRTRPGIQVQIHHTLLRHLPHVTYDIHFYLNYMLYRVNQFFITLWFHQVVLDVLEVLELRLISFFQLSVHVGVLLHTTYK